MLTKCLRLAHQKAFFACPLKLLKVHLFGCHWIASIAISEFYWIALLTIQVDRLFTEWYLERNQNSLSHLALILFECVKYDGCAANFFDQAVWAACKQAPLTSLQERRTIPGVRHTIRCARNERDWRMLRGPRWVTEKVRECLSE